MKNLFKAIVVIFLFGFTTLHAQSGVNNCNMSVTYSEMAFSNFKRVYQMDSSEELKVILKKAVEEAEQASAYALICNCPLAKNYALNAVTFGNKALKSESTEEIKKYTKQAMNMSLDVLTATPNCKN